jgi:hypothetical protein
MGQRFVACDREQSFLMPPDVREWLPSRHLAWFVIDAVGEMDLDAFYVAYRVDGRSRPPYDLDLIPLAGATLAGILLATVGFLTSITAGIVVLGFFILYQQLENHVLQPLVYGRTVQLSPLVVLIAILIGTEVAGVLGALAAIPVAGTLQILLLDWLRHRRIDGEGGATAVAAEAVEEAT